MIKRLKLDDKEIILVGTAHISQESVKLVEDTIAAEQPDVIGVELDRERLEQLLSGKKWQEMNVVELVKSGKTYLFLLNVMLSNMQRQLGEHVGVQPGAEMLAAIKIAGTTNTPIQMLDRDVRVTLKRAFNQMKVMEKARLGYWLLASMFGFGEKVAITTETIEQLKREDLINRLMKELGTKLPSMKRVLVDERDSYIAEMIRISPGKKIVAVVGAGHMNGIIEIIQSQKKSNLQKLTEMPKKNPLIKLLGYIIPAIFVIMIIYALISKGTTTTLNLLVMWALITGVCSALGALVARSHPLTILTAAIVAPITTLHPALAAGWFAAIAETRFNPPRVMDFEALTQVSSVTGFYKNKVTHILIVAALTNIGATIGVVIALPYFLALLA